MKHHMKHHTASKRITSVNSTSWSITWSITQLANVSYQSTLHPISFHLAQTGACLGKLSKILLQKTLFNKTRAQSIQVDLFIERLYQLPPYWFFFFQTYSYEAKMEGSTFKVYQFLLSADIFLIYCLRSSIIDYWIEEVSFIWDISSDVLW